MGEVNQRRLGLRVGVVFSATAVILLLLVVLTNPQQGGPLVILFMQLLLFLAVSSGVYGIILAANRYIGTRITSPRAAVCALAAGLGTVLIVGLQTLNQLNISDIILVLLLEAGLIFYAFRRMGSYKS